MGVKQKTVGNPGPAGTTVVVMCLYIADSAPNSMRAIENLEAICREHLHGHFKLEIIDVLKYPLRALADGIVVTPSLAKKSPAPTTRIVGNLSDKSSVLRALGIRTSSAEPPRVLRPPPPPTLLAAHRPQRQTHEPQP